MRFLKNKIAKAQELLLNKEAKSLTENDQEEQTNNFSTSPSHNSMSLNVSQPKRRRRVQGRYFTSERARSTKNVVKNYGKAICSFAVSELALLYLMPLIERENVSREGFVQFIANIKEAIESIQSFRSILLIDENDTPEIKSYKRIFVAIGEVFIKFFSVNWIFSGRITHRIAHLKFRFKMLRRIRDPENFFYIQKPCRRRKDAF